MDFYYNVSFPFISGRGKEEKIHEGTTYTWKQSIMKATASGPIVS